MVSVHLFVNHPAKPRHQTVIRQNPCPQCWGKNCCKYTAVLSSCKKMPNTEAEDCKPCCKSLTRMLSVNVPQKPSKSCNDSKTETTGQMKNQPRLRLQRRPLECGARFVTQCIGTKTSNHAPNDKNCPYLYLKGTPSLPPLDWEQPHISIYDVTCDRCGLLQWNCWKPHREYWKWILK